MLDSVNRGGAEMLTLDVCRNADAAGMNLTFVASGGGDLESDFAKSAPGYVRLHRRLPIDPQLVSQLRKIINERKIQIAHAQQAVEAIHLYLATRGTDVKCVMSLQAYILNTKNRLATKFIVPRMDAACPVSQSMQEWYRTGEGFAITDKYHVILNGVDAARLGPVRDPGKISLRDELGVDPSGKLIGMVGNFYPDARKDQLTISRALPAVLREFAKAHFVFVGAAHSGARDYYDKCAAICSDNGILDRVHFVGKRSDIPDLLRELDLFVFSSMQEGLPVAAVEALMIGVPMLVSDIPPLLEVVGADTSEGACAEIFRTGDVDHLAAKMIDLLRDDERRRKLGDKARIQTPKRFDIAAHLRSLSALYERLTTDNRQ